MRILILSLGNPLKRDDNVANIVVSKIKRKMGRLLISGETNPENFISKIKEYAPDKMFVIDAVRFGGNVGEVKRFSIGDLESASYSTHNIPVSLVSKLVGRGEIEIIGIQPKTIDYGTSLSKELKMKLPKIIKDVKRLISRDRFPE